MKLVRSLLFVEGINPAEIAEQLGHSCQMLLSTYTHVIEELRRGERHSAEALIKQAREEMLTQSSHKALGAAITDDNHRLSRDSFEADARIRTADPFITSEVSTGAGSYRAYP
jgi:hypothetical protein